MALYAGLMSGTSMDAIDVAIAEFADAKPPVLLCGHRHPLPANLKSELEALIHSGAQNEPAGLLWRLDAELGNLLGEAANAAFASAGVEKQQILAIGSHGQTVYHAPNDNPAISIQLGDPNRIAALTGVTTVADFRRADLAHGGQGAPLMPAYHNAFLRDALVQRAVVNIGGIANVTLLAPGAETQRVVGFDTGPGNTLLDGWIRRCKGENFDRDGAWAESGKPLPALLKRLLADPYFSLPPPKSTGREHFNLAWLEGHLDGSEKAADVQRTALELTAKSIAQGIRLSAQDAGEVMLCGGGAYNTALLKAIRAHLSAWSVDSIERAGHSAEWLEAVGFAWFAKNTLERKPSNLPSVTGARNTVVLGGIYPACDATGTTT